MSNFRDQLEEIKTLLSSNKSFAYSTLLHLQEQATTDHSLVQSLADSSHPLLSSILVDINDADEEIAAQALKCLGFMTYHPAILVKIPGDDATMILDSLEKVITTTKIKFNASLLAAHLQSLLRAVIHALDNPIGSLSTTYEAIQAVMKLTTQLSEMMRDTSNIWAPPIYRRLVSTDKREKDMAERCLLKIWSTVCPPPLLLSKAVALDMKKKLLPAMKELVSEGMKIRALQAWGWYIRLIGPYAIKNRHLVNEMLKIPEQTFSDLDSQVQIATQVSAWKFDNFGIMYQSFLWAIQVAWEGLIDALIRSPTKALEINTTTEQHIRHEISYDGNNGEVNADGYLKRLRLIMTPLTGILSSNCDVSVRSHCLNTWCYLLHKLDTSVNCPSVINTVCLPIFEVVFEIGPQNMNIWFWNFCVDMLNDFALARSKDACDDLNNRLSSQLSAKSPIVRPPVSGEYSSKHYPIKWLHWDLSQLEFFIKMVHLLISHGSLETVAPEIKILACNAALRIFRAFLEGVQNVLKNSSTTYTDLMLCLSATLTCVKKICEDTNSEDSGINDLRQISLQFVEAITEELESSILGSPLYKVPLDLKYIDNLGSVHNFRHVKIVGPSFTDDTNMVLPIVYLTILYFSVVAKSIVNAPEAESILERMFRFLRSSFSSYDPPEILVVVTGLLYRHLSFNRLNIWFVIANCLKDYIEGVKDPSLLKTAVQMNGYHLICHLLGYPFAVFSFPHQIQLTSLRTSSGSMELSPVSAESQRKLELEHVIEVWKSLYVSVLHASRFECSSSQCFSEDLSSMLNGFLDESTSMTASSTVVDAGENHWDLYLISLCGNVVICVLEQILTSELSYNGSKSKVGSHIGSSGLNNSLGFVARFTRLAQTNAAIGPPTDLLITSRLFSTLVHFVHSLHLKEDIILFFEIFSSSLLQWLSHEVQDKNTNHQLQLLWNEILNSLQISSPPINFDSSLLNLQSTLLKKTLDHPHLSISEPTITFWNSTYGEQSKLDYPQTLLPVLDKLSRTGKIKLGRRKIAPNSEKVVQRVDDLSSTQRYKVTATLNSRSSKRVELVKRKRSEELTEHQKEVRRAQQGKMRDCDGRGPGVRTYTSVDFSQGNEDESQESQDIPNADAILERLKRDGAKLA
ncbi:hypothetical protein LguiB_011569 [Lonicera macranthoides]